MFFILLRAVVPCVYSLLVGIAFSILLNRKLLYSIPTAFCTQIVIMILTGIIFGSVSIGMWIMIVLCGLVCVFGIFIHRGDRFYRNIGIEQILFFTVIYALIYIADYKKCFDSWDEFSHWGHFVKETLRLDALFCTSPLRFVHKDYVPAVPVFEALWNRLSFGYSEANTFRAIQMLQISMIIPAALKNESIDGSESKK